MTVSEVVKMTVSEVVKNVHSQYWYQYSIFRPFCQAIQGKMHAFRLPHMFNRKPHAAPRELAACGFPVNMCGSQTQAVLYYDIIAQLVSVSSTVFFQFLLWFFLTQIFFDFVFCVKPSRLRTRCCCPLWPSWLCTRCRCPLRPSWLCMRCRCPLRPSWLCMRCRCPLRPSWLCMRCLCSFQ